MALRHVHTENSSQGKEGMASYAADEAAELLQHWMFGFVMSVIWSTHNPDRLRAPRVVGKRKLVHSIGSICRCGFKPRARNDFIETGTPQSGGMMGRTLQVQDS